VSAVPCLRDAVRQGFHLLTHLVEQASPLLKTHDSNAIEGFLVYIGKLQSGLGLRIKWTFGYFGSKSLKTSFVME